MGARDHLRIALDGAVRQLYGGDAFLPLSTLLRERLRLLGTKIVCSEGDCGACTVLAGTPENGRFVYRPIDSCIAFPYQLDGCHVVTVEGLARAGAGRAPLHPVQRALAESFGSQCGFCTPGFAVALAALAEAARARGAPLSDAELRIGLSGNLCRCTGYVQILEAARAVDPQTVPPLAALFDEAPLLAALGPARREPVRIESDGRSLALPASWEEALALRAHDPAATVVAGATDVGVQINTRLRAPARILHLRPELPGYAAVESEDGLLRLGAGARWSEVLAATRALVPELAAILARFGAPQIRNLGTVGGNLVNASPIADSLPFLYVAEATVALDSVRGRRTVPIAEFYLGYKQLDLAPDELLARVEVPLPAPDESIRLLKVSRRNDLDISTFTAALRLRRAGARIVSARVAMGGVAPTVLRLPETEALLAGAAFDLDTFRAAGERAAAEIRPISDVRGSAGYRLLLARNALVRFFHELAGEPSLAAPAFAESPG
jgi:xanthine dehydrogenase small subunit